MKSSIIRPLYKTFFMKDSCCSKKSPVNARLARVLRITCSLFSCRVFSDSASVCFEISKSSKFLTDSCTRMVLAFSGSAEGISSIKTLSSSWLLFESSEIVVSVGAGFRFELLRLEADFLVKERCFSIKTGCGRASVDSSILPSDGGSVTTTPVEGLFQMTKFSQISTLKIW